MNVYAHPLLTIVWIATIACNSATAYIALFRPAQFHYRYFGWITAWFAVVSSSLVGCSFARAGWTYHYIYWTTAATRPVLVTVQAIICFRLIFGPYRVMPRKFFWQFFGSLLALTVALALAFTFFPSPREDRGALFTLLRSTDIWLCGVFWIISLFSDRYRLPCDVRAYGICIGFMVHYTAAVAISIAYAHMTGFKPGGSAVVPIYTVVLVSELVVAIIWLRAFLRPEIGVARLDEVDLGKLSEILSKAKEQRNHFAGTNPTCVLQTEHRNRTAQLPPAGESEREW